MLCTKRRLAKPCHGMLHTKSDLDEAYQCSNNDANSDKMPEAWHKVAMPRHVLAPRRRLGQGMELQQQQGGCRSMLPRQRPNLDV